MHESNGRWIAYVGHHGGRALNALAGRDEDNGTSVAIQTNNVDVDDRGNIYIVDRANTGMHILEYTGSR